MPTLNYGTGSHTVNVDERWINILVTVAGAQGGNGGSDGGVPGGTRGPGRVGTFRLNNDGFARTLYLRVGSQGGNGFGCVANGGNGGGGSSPVASGGGGGRTGPQGCSGGGGGGGGATGIYDSYSNMYIILAGAGGGAGGGSYPDGWLRGGNGGSAGGWSTSISGIGSGGGGASQGFDGGGGGGGGGGAGGGGGGRQGADGRAGRYPSTGGGGGGSYYVTSYTTYYSGNGSNYGNGYVSISYDLANPEVTSLTTSDSAVIQGENVTVSWTTSYTNFISSMTLTAPNGTMYDVTGTTSITVPAQASGNWWLAVYYSGGRDDAYVYQTAYIPPEITFYADDQAIVRGDSTVLRWSVIGDASTMTITPGIGSSNLSSYATISPTVTTTYTAVAQGSGGIDTKEVTILVYQPPTVSISGPAYVNYGEDVPLSYQMENGTTEFTLTATDIDLDLNSSDRVFGLVPQAGPVDTVTTDTPPYHNRGPERITYTLYAKGAGNPGQETTDVNDTTGTITTSALQNMSIQVTRDTWSGSTGTSGNPVGSLKYIVYISGVVSPVIGVGIHDDTLRASGLVDPEGSIAVSSGYPVQSGNTFEIAFDMWTDSTRTQRQATFVRDWFITISGSGFGGLTDTDQHTVYINIDETPLPITIPESEDKLKSEAPVITPDVEITTEQLVVDDIDIPVEIKADSQIQVQIDEDGNWLNVRQIQSPK